ncbi:YraN family protein [Rhizorhabdus argentea]|uniref:YraN family protein n=1 Tax=Rhizorhabdus argentea TaxID=1387174 RepID=UPI0030EDA140
MNRRAAEQQGRSGERMAAWWLRLQGWRIVGERVRTHRGEVDLIARRGRTLAFIEVKTRGDAAALALAIDEYRLRRVIDAAHALVARYGAGAENIRIDVMLVRPWRVPVHLKNVWHG